MEYIMRTSHLSYPPVFENLSLSVGKNSFTSISGSNNCGKTTLIKILSGLISTNEMVCLNYSFADFADKKKFYRQVEVLFPTEDPVFLFSKVSLELCFPLENLKESKEQIEKRACEVVDQLRLQDFLEKDPHSLKGFDLLRFRLALAVIGKPEILLLDDPFLFLTQDQKKELLYVFKEWKKEGMTIVMTTSNLEDTITCDYLYLLDRGKIALEGTPLSLFEKEKEITKLGLKLPFLADISLKLQFYNLIDHMELSQEKLVDLLWK